MKILTNISGNQSNATWTLQSQQVTILDATNPGWPRAVILSTNGVRVSRGNNQAGFALSDLLLAAVGMEPNLTWPPIITANPNNTTANAPNATSFAGNANAETGVAIAYQWQKSTDNGGNWSNLTNAGVYSNVTTNVLNISNTTGLNGNQFRFVAVDVSGSNNSNAAILTVADPVILSVTNAVVGNAISMNVSAQGGSPLSYQWQNSNTNSDPWTNVVNGGIFSNATTNHFNISNFVTEHSNYYRPLVVDSAGNVAGTPVQIP